jgi:hypothetical protein
MKAAVYRRYGPPDVVKIEDIHEPSPKENEVLLKVRAASVNPLDAGLIKGKPLSFRLLFGLSKPRLTRPGVDVAGQVEAVGRNVTRFKPGDEVFGSCRGAFAEYACAHESKLVIKPANVTFEQAASVPLAALTALQGLRDKGHIEPGQKVLINSAAGGVGTFAVQIAKSFSAEVTGACSHKECGLGPVDRRGSCHRLHAAGFHRKWGTLRPDFRLLCEPFVVSMQARLKSEGNVRDGRRTGQTVDNRHSGSCRQSAHVVTVRQPQVRRVHGEIEQRGPGHHKRTHGDGKGNAGHRQALQVE